MVRPSRRQHSGSMTTDQTEAPLPPPPPPYRPHDLGSLRRSVNDRHVAGVAGGLARHFDIDPIIVRVALVVLVFFGGAGVILYVGAWLLVPEDGTTEAVVRLDDRSRSFLLYVVGGIAGLALLGDTIGDFHTPWGLLVVGAIVVLILSNRDRLRWRSSQSPTSPHNRYAPEAPTATAGAAGSTQDVTLRFEQRAEQQAGQEAAWRVQRYDARRRGPILFWFTIALVLLAQACLAVVDLAGVDVAVPAYPGLALGVIGLMLVLSAFWGRGGGLILLGLLSAVVLVGATAADQWGLDHRSRTVTYVPTTSAAVLETYDHNTGELTLDLSRVSDAQALTGRTIRISSHVGTIDVIVPADLNVVAHGEVHGPGQVDLFDDGSGGIGTSLTNSIRLSPTGLSAAPLTIDADLNVGRITVETR